MPRPFSRRLIITWWLSDDSIAAILLGCGVSRSTRPEILYCRVVVETAFLVKEPVLRKRRLYIRKRLLFDRKGLGCAAFRICWINIYDLGQSWG